MHKKTITADLEALVAFAATGIDFFTSGISEDQDGWWAVVYKFVGGGKPAEQVRKCGPFKDRDEARAKADEWGKAGAKRLNLFQ